jgi:predicted amidohydrolase YtcJ
MPVASAIDAYTRDAAYASFDELRKGVLAPGMLADIVVLSTDILALSPDQLLDGQVDVTIFDGKVVFERQASPLSTN